MAGVVTRSFDAPDETRSPDKTRVDIVRLGSTTAGRFAFEPGWRWSDCVRPVAGTDSCQARHVGVVHSGRLVVRHEGAQLEGRLGHPAMLAGGAHGRPWTPPDVPGRLGGDGRGAERPRA